MNSKKLKNYYSSDSVHGIKHNLTYYKMLKDLLEAHKTQKENILFRKRVLDSQKRNNYQIEYDRIRNYLHDHNIMPQTRQNLEDRKHELKLLGAKAINSIK